MVFFSCGSSISRKQLYGCRRLLSSAAAGQRPAVAVLPGAYGEALAGSSQQQQQHLITLQGLRPRPAAPAADHWASPEAVVVAGIPALNDYGMLATDSAASAAAAQGSMAPAAAAAAPTSWEATLHQARQRRQQFQRHKPQQQQQQQQAVLPTVQQGADHLHDSSAIAMVYPIDVMQTDTVRQGAAPDTVNHLQQGTITDITAMAGTVPAAGQQVTSSAEPSGISTAVTESLIDLHAMDGTQQSSHAPSAGANIVVTQDSQDLLEAVALTNSRHSSSSSSTDTLLPVAGAAARDEGVTVRSLAQAATDSEQPQPSVSDDGAAAAGLDTAAAEQLLQPGGGGGGGGVPPGLTGDMTAAAATGSHVADDDPAAAAAAAAGGGPGGVATAATPAGVAELSSTPTSGGNTAVLKSDDSSTGVSAAPPPWKPKVLDAPVPKWPRLYATVAPPAPTLSAELAPAAVSALLAAARDAKTPQGISISGIPGLTLEDKILLARLLGHVIQGNFDAAGQMDPSSTAYWEYLDAQIDKHTQVKHMFESIWYKCSKLNADLLMRTSSAYDMEVEALQHILAWLGFPEKHLPRPGEFADFDDLVTLLDGIGATARLVSDPVPFLQTTRPPLDRNGMPLLIHMTFKDKGQFARHHLLSLASWAKENPDHAILMYDDADLEAYLSTYDPSVLKLYGSLKTAVERSDLWRYVVMCKHGGVYTDADTLCVRPIQEWNKENLNDAEAVFGVEDVFKRDPNGGNSGWGVSQGRFGIQFEQWTLAGAPNHPVYCNMHSFISQRIIDEASKQSSAATTESENWSILHRTGPHVWTDSVLNWMHDQGIGFHEALVPGGRLVANNTRIMPGETFGCAAHFFSPAARLEEVYAMHMFRGVWRKRLDSGGGEVDRHHIRLGF